MKPRPVASLVAAKASQTRLGRLGASELFRILRVKAFDKGIYIRVSYRGLGLQEFLEVHGQL